MKTLESNIRAATLNELANQGILCQEQADEIILGHQNVNIPRFLGIISCPGCGEGSVITSFSAEQTYDVMASLINHTLDHDMEPLFICDLDTRQSEHEFFILLDDDGETVVGVAPKHQAKPVIFV